MKITFVVSQYNRISGGNRALFEYSNRLQDRGHEVSWYEGLGMPSMEAMACGAALVTTDTGGSWDYAADGDTAFGFSS